MIYLGIFYKENGEIIIREFNIFGEMKMYIKINKNKYFAYDIYMAKCINNKIRIGE